MAARLRKIKAQLRQLQRRAAEEGATTRDTVLKPKHMRAFWESLADPPEEEAADVPEKVREFAKLTLKWMDGKRGYGSQK